MTIGFDFPSLLAFLLIIYSIVMVIYAMFVSEKPTFRLWLRSILIIYPLFLLLTSLALYLAGNTIVGFVIYLVIVAVLDAILSLYVYQRTRNKEEHK